MKATHLLSAFLLAIGSCLTASAADPSKAGGLPPGEKDAKAAIQVSPRHGEYVDVQVPGHQVPLKCYVVYPEVKEKAPVVIVIHEIFGLSDWIKGVADQLAADGFIAIAPDMISGHGKNGGGSESYDAEKERDQIVQAVRQLKPDEVTADLNAVRDYGMKLPASNGKTGTIGFCWGGGQSFGYAANQPELNAAAVYYGTPPKELDNVKAPVMGFYGGNDNRVTSTVKPTEEAMKKLNKPYTPHVFDGAGHGFLRQQDGQNGANMKATQAAWPATISFLKENLK
jgi:carboxymethylenebutenolidase